MKFEVGKFYMHITGKKIAVLDIVVTYAWGEMFIVEECIPCDGGIGHFVSGLDKGSEDVTGAWTEIGKDEFVASFQREVGR